MENISLIKENLECLINYQREIRKKLKFSTHIPWVVTLNPGVVSPSFISHISASHSSSVIKLLVLPWQPPYTNLSHLCCSRSQYQRTMYPRHGPGSLGMSHVNIFSVTAEPLSSPPERNQERIKAKPEELWLRWLLISFNYKPYCALLSERFVSNLGMSFTLPSAQFTSINIGIY